MFGLNFNSIKTQVGSYLIINILLVVLGYVFTYWSEESAKRDTILIQVADENLNYLNQIQYLSSAIINGDGELKNTLEKETSSFETNLNALSNEEGGGEAIIKGKVISNVPSSPRSTRSTIKQLESKWSKLESELQILIDRQAYVDSSIVLKQKASEEAVRKLNVEKQREEIDTTQKDIVQIISPTVVDTLAPQIKEDSIQEKQIDKTIKEDLEVKKDDIKGFIPIKVKNEEVANAYHRFRTRILDVKMHNLELKALYEKNKAFDETWFFWFITVFNVGNFIALLVGFTLLNRFFLNPLANIAKTAKEVAIGDTKVKAEYDRKNEIGEVADSLNLVVSSFQQYTGFAESVGQGKFDANFEVKSEKDTLGYTLLAMRDGLKRASEEDKKRNWSNEGFAKFTNILRTSSEDIEITELSYAVISNLVMYVNAIQGAIFLFVDDLDKQEKTDTLEMTASFAYNKRKLIDKKVKVGQGLVGQAVLEKQTIYIKKAPQDYVSVTSGLGQANPEVLLIIPLTLNEEVLGVIEIASFHLFKDYEIEFIEQISENIASTLSNAKITANTKFLLEETKQFAEQMAAQEEEMKQNMEVLSVTQTEMRKNQEQLVETKENLEKEVEIRTAELKDNQQQLAMTLSQLQGIIDSARAGIVALDTEYKVLAANERIRKMVKAVRGTEFVIGGSWLDIFTTEEAEARAKALWDRAISGESIQIEDAFTLVNGKTAWYDITFSPIIDEKEIVIGASMFARDISDRVKSQKVTQRMAHILDNSTNEVYLFDAESLKFIDVNERGRKNLGYSIEELMELTPYEIEPRFDREGFIKHIEPLRYKMVENMLIETTYLRKDGSMYEVELNMQLFEDDEKPVFAAIVQDITKRKDYENKLQEAINRFDMAANASQEGLWEMYVNPNDPVNPDNEAFWSKQFKELLGFTEQEFENKLDSWIVRMHPEDKATVLRRLYEHLMDKSGKTTYQLEYRLYTKKDEYVWFAAIADTQRDENGLPQRIVGTIRNITIEKEAEQQLAQQNAVVGTILNAAVNSILTVDKFGKINSVNKATLEVFKYEEVEILGKNISALFSSKDTKGYDNYLDEYLKNIKGIQERTAVRKGGEDFPVDISISVSEEGVEEQFYVLIIRDITERKEKERRLEEREDRYRRIEIATTEGIIFYDDNIIIDSSETFEKITGYSSSFLKGKDLLSIFKEDTHFTVLQHLTGEGEPFDSVIVKQNGESMDVEVLIKYIDIEDGSETIEKTMIIRQKNFGK